MVFPVVMYGCESWTRKKPEYRRTDAFKLFCWRRLLRVPWIARKSHQLILREINPEYLLEGLMLKPQYFGTWCEEPTHWNNRVQDGWMASLTQWTWVWASSRSWWSTGKPGMLQSMGSQRGHDWATELNWTTSLPHKEHTCSKHTCTWNNYIHRKRITRQVMVTDPGGFPKSTLHAYPF